MDPRLSAVVCSFRVASVAAGAVCRPRHAGCWQPQLRLVADGLLSESDGYSHGACPCCRFEPVSTLVSWTLLESKANLFALSRFIKSVSPANAHLAHIASLSILLSPGLLIIDHIHFQYNGFMYGLLILSIVLARKQSTLLCSGIVFAVLLCLKHIHLYLALAYFVYLLRAYCLDPRSVFKPRFGNTFRLGLSVLVVLGLAFGPFAYWNQLLQLKDRLFPFSRGLCHAYWAPNIWAIYSSVDRFLIQRMYYRSGS